jgi:hypothetical protein
MSNPKIDSRSREAIEKEIKILASTYLPQWNIKVGDVGWTLAQSFSKMTEDIIKNLNGIPQKLFIDFLDKLEFRLTPPLSAKAPILFELAKGTKNSKLIPKNTQVADKNGIMFETENSFSVTPAKLTMLYSVDPNTDAIYNHSKNLDDKDFFSLFNGDNKQKHILYFGDPNLFNFNKGYGDFTYVKLIVPSSPSYIWKYYAGVNKKREDPWIELTEYKENNNIKNEISIQKEEFEESTVKKKINGYECYWIKATIKSDTKQSTVIPKIIYEGASGIDALYYNDIPINPKYVLTEKKKKETEGEKKNQENIYFYPFGHEPKQNDIFYLASNEAFSKKGLPLTISFVVKSSDSNNQVKKTDLSWEYWNGKSWKSLDYKIDEWLKIVTNYQVESKKEEPYFPKQISYICPMDIEETQVNGEKNYWIRVKLLTNSYGSYKMEYNNLIATFNPPQIGKITIYINNQSYISDQNYKRVITPKHILSFNNLEYKDSRSITNIIYPLEETKKTLYLGFDKIFGEGLISLFFNIKSANKETKRYLQFYYYSTNNSWEALNVKDETNGLIQSGMCEFIAPTDQALLVKFNNQSYWLKIELIQDIGNSKDSTVEIENIYLNSTWAKQRESIKEELIGSSDGSANQKFYLLRKYIKELRLWIREPMKPENGNLSFYEDSKSGFWVLWKEVPSLSSSTPTSREYKLDPVSGEIEFGNNTYGFIPPVGKNSIKGIYKIGGGVEGNIERGEIKELVATINSVDKVQNIIDSSGGSNTQSIENLIKNTPKKLKTRDRAITIEDYETLAKEASSDIAKVKAFRSTKNSISVAIIPFSKKMKPICSRELIKNITTYLENRSALTSKLLVVEPEYSMININTTLVLDKWDLLSEIKERVQNDLKSFLHPIYGGYDKQGWDFGEIPCFSDFFTIFENIDGIKYVKDLTIEVSLENQTPLNLVRDNIENLKIKPNTLTCSGIHIIKMEGE